MNKCAANTLMPLGLSFFSTSFNPFNASNTYLISASFSDLIAVFFPFHHDGYFAA
jgi:hypothetical protein